MKRLRQEGERMVEFWVALTGLLPISFLTAPEIPPPEYPPPITAQTSSSVHLVVYPWLPLCWLSAHRCPTQSGMYVSSFSLDYNLFEGRPPLVAPVHTAQWMPTRNQVNKQMDYCEIFLNGWESEEEVSFLGKHHSHQKLLPRLHFNVFIYFCKDSQCKLPRRVPLAAHSRVCLECATQRCGCHLT